MLNMIQTKPAWRAFLLPMASVVYKKTRAYGGENDDIQSAEKRMLEETCPKRTEEQRQMQPKFLAHFATSAAFSETSRLGSFRFTFTLREVLDAYREQVEETLPAAFFDLLSIKKNIVWQW